MPEATTRGGRPTKFNPDRARRAVVLARASERRIWIARAIGVSKRTLQEWIRRGRAGDPVFADWAEAFDRATEWGRRRSLRLRYAAEADERRRSWQRFRMARQAWWYEKLGPNRFWLGRAVWLEVHGHHDAANRIIARLVSGDWSFCTSCTP
jgi:hypothetical protein